MYELSVIVPVYNGEKYLKTFLDSLTQQNVKDMEVILIDDGSIDNTLNIIKEYCNLYSTWQYIINEKNKGLNPSRNIGLKKSKGKYIIFCDADDYIPKNTFKKMLENNQNYDVITGQVKKFSEEYPPITYYDYDEKNNFYIWEDDMNKFIFSDISEEIITNIYEYPKLICNLSPWCNIFKKKLISHYFEEGEGYINKEGGLFAIPLLFKANTIKIMSFPVYYWRYNSNSLSVKEGLSKDKLIYIFRELMLINDFDLEIANTFFEMILQIILPAFVTNKKSNYY